MWQSIKKFFKRIADCTGISWIARKISSGWNSVKNWWSGNKVTQVSQKSVAIQTDTQIQKATLINSITEVGDKLVLSVDNALLSKISESHHSIQKVYIECNKGKFEVTLEKLLGLNDNVASYII
ncbi:hypothetical protein GO685_05305, partial [Wolbachia endosymbiont of Madathamugadia hiepei]|nr:hypothetical protein [Wolbachia endosymbiont of Madathamugadia hiepei]